MTRNQIELYAMHRGMTGRQASAFADEVMSKRHTPRNYSDLNILVVPFALAAGIALTTLDVVGDVAEGVLDVGLSIGVGVVDVGMEIVGGIFSIFD